MSICRIGPALSAKMGVGLSFGKEHFLNENLSRGLGRSRVGFVCHEAINGSSACALLADVLMNPYA